MLRLVFTCAHLSVKSNQQGSHIPFLFFFRVVTPNISNSERQKICDFDPSPSHLSRSLMVSNVDGSAVPGLTKGISVSGSMWDDPNRHLRPLGQLCGDCGRFVHHVRQHGETEGGTGGGEREGVQAWSVNLPFMRSC